MATITRFPRTLLVLSALLATLTAPAAFADDHAGIGTSARPVAFYDVETVLRESRSLTDVRARFDAALARYDAESTSLRDDVRELRDRVMHGQSMPIAERRDLEAQLAQRTIALLVARTEGAREIAAERVELLATLDGRIAPVVRRIAAERQLPVVIRANAATVVLDEDAIDLSPALIAALDGEPRDAEPASPDMPRRLRFQSCDAGAPTELAAASR